MRAQGEAGTTGPQAFAAGFCADDDHPACAGRGAGAERALPAVWSTVGSILLTPGRGLKCGDSSDQHTGCGQRRRRWGWLWQCPQRIAARMPKLTGTGLVIPVYGSVAEAVAG